MLLRFPLSWATQLTQSSPNRQPLWYILQVLLYRNPFPNLLLRQYNAVCFSQTLMGHLKKYYRNALAIGMGLKFFYILPLSPLQASTSPFSRSLAQICSELIPSGIDSLSPYTDLQEFLSTHFISPFKSNFEVILPFF